MEDSEARIGEYYDDLAPHWPDIVDSPERDEAIWPTLEAMLPELDGGRVLDAGCGAGVYAEWFAERGADVVGVDVSESMIGEAAERVPEGSFVQADLGEPLDFLGTDSVDVVLCQHVFSHLPDLEPPLSEFARVLTDGGVLAASTHNPAYDYVVVRDGEYPPTAGHAHLDPVVEAGPDAPTYAETERFDVRYEGAEVADRGTYYRRPVEGLVSPLLSAGFSLEEVVERAVDEGNGETDRDYPPESICLKATL